MIPQVNRREEQCACNREKNNKESFFKAPGKIDHEEGYSGMAAWEGVSLDPFKPVQKVLEGGCYEEAFKGAVVQMFHCKSRADSGPEIQYAVFAHSFLRILINTFSFFEGFRGLPFI